MRFLDQKNVYSIGRRTMPPSTICCEFCKTEMRKDAYMGHIQAKHIADMGQLLLRDWAHSNVTPIAQWAASKAGKIMVIHSHMYDDHEYWFGMKPCFWKNDAKGYSEYLKVEANIEYHQMYLEGIMKAVSLYDWIAIKKDVLIKGAETITMKIELNELKKRYVMEMEIAKEKIDQLQATINELQTTIDLPYGTVPEMEKKMQHYECNVQKMKADRERDKREIEMLKRFNEEQDERQRREHLAEVRYWQDKTEKTQCAYDKMMDEVTENKEAIQQRIAKHLEKEETKKQKELERERQRDEEEYKKAEKKYKALQKRMLRGNDSDSD